MHVSGVCIAAKSLVWLAARLPAKCCAYDLLMHETHSTNFSYWQLLDIAGCSNMRTAALLT
jgi:hypothetical protein